MPSEVLELLQKVKTVTLPMHEEIQTVSELLEVYPGFKLDPSIDGKKNIWHDLMKRASPEGLKTKRDYNPNELNKLLNEELDFLVRACNFIRRLLKITTAKRKKKIFLNAIEHQFGVSLETGGGAPKRTQRVVIIFNKEGNITKGSRSVQPPTSTASKRKLIQETVVQNEWASEYGYDSPFVHSTEDNMLKRPTNHSVEDHLQYNNELSSQHFQALMSGTSKSYGISRYGSEDTFDIDEGIIYG